MKKTDNDISFGDLTEHTGYHIRRAHSTFMRLFAYYGKEFSLRSQQASILVLARENPGISPAAVAGAIEIERSLMTKLLSDLTDRGYVEARTSATDGRQKGLYITPSGNRFSKAVMKTFWQNLEPALTGNLSPREKQTLIKLLQKLYAGS